MFKTMLLRQVKSALLAVLSVLKNDTGAPKPLGEPSPASIFSRLNLRDQLMGGLCLPS